MNIVNDCNEMKQRKAVAKRTFVFYNLVHNWHARTSWIAKFSLISFDINSYFMNPGNTSRKACVTQRKALLSDGIGAIDISRKRQMTKRRASHAE